MDKCRVIDFSAEKKKRESGRGEQKGAREEIQEEGDPLKRFEIQDIPEGALWNRLDLHSQKFFADFLRTVKASRGEGHFVFNLGTLMNQKQVVRLWDEGYVIGFASNPINQSAILARPHFGLALLGRLKER